MISNLSIKNYALIDDISVSFNAGFNIITGETGAGKSIILGALGLLLGKRADLSSVKDVSKKCIIEGEFLLKSSTIVTIFKENNLDFDRHTIVRRELLPSGKSRAFVNDSPVTVSQLQTLAPYLVDIHSQQDTVNLFSETFQIEVIDVLAGNSELLKNYTKELHYFNDLSNTITELNYKKESSLKELDYNTFLYNELLEADLKNRNQKKLEELYETLNNIEEIQESLSVISQLFSAEQIGSLETLKEARNYLGKLQKFSTEYNDLWSRLNSVVIELEDISEAIDSTISSVEANPSLLFEINEKLQILYKLQQKHSVSTVLELLEIQNALAKKIDVTSNLDNQIETLLLEQASVKENVLKIAKKIHVRRIKVIPTLKEKLTNILSDLGLPNAAFKFEITSSEKFRKNGTDILKLLFTANKGLPFGELKKVASGGELSRLMLAIKAVLAQYKSLPTLVFDEIDTGVSGEIAYKMASILKQMSSTMQLLCITHLPQIAAAGMHHLKVYKEDIDDFTVTKLRVLNKQERVTEIAEMIGGKSHTETAIKQAEELLN